MGDWIPVLNLGSIALFVHVLWLLSLISHTFTGEQAGFQLFDSKVSFKFGFLNRVYMMDSRSLFDRFPLLSSPIFSRVACTSDIAIPPPHPSKY